MNLAPQVFKAVKCIFDTDTLLPDIFLLHI